MIIDLHTRIWSSPEQLGQECAASLRREQAERWGQFDASTEAHEEAMSCVDAAVVMGFRSARLGALIPNEFIASIVARDPQRRIGFGCVDPVGEDPDGQMQNIISLGLSGVVMSPASQGYHPLHSSAMRIYEKCSEASLPIMVTMDGPRTSSVEIEFARPGHLDEVARTFPHVRIVIGQLGQPWIDETLYVLSKHANLFADLSGVASRPWQLYNALVGAEEHGVMDRLLFGSGFPRTLPAKAIENLYSINQFSQGTQLPSVPRSHVRDIIERDSLACLGIESEVLERMPRSDEPSDVSTLDVDARYQVTPQSSDPLSND